MRNTSARPPLVIGCGALAEELVQLTRRAGLPPMDLTCLPASLHNRPEQIPSRVAARIRRARADGYARIFVAYADCGTGGLLDRMLETEPAAEGVTRLEGAHCYEVYAGRAAFAALHDEEPGTFYLTDYLARNFERLVVRGLGLDRHPELLPMYFGNYRRLVYLAQSDDAELSARAAAAAARLGDLAFERRFIGLGELATGIAVFASAPSVAARGAASRPAFPTADIAPDSTARPLGVTRSGHYGGNRAASDPQSAVPNGQRSRSRLSARIGTRQAVGRDHFRCSARPAFQSHAPHRGERGLAGPAR